MPVETGQYIIVNVNLGYLPNDGTSVAGSYEQNNAYQQWNSFPTPRRTADYGDPASGERKNMPQVETGQYIIVNVRQRNLAYLPDPNDGTPVAANYEQNNACEQWNVNKLSNGNHTIKSVGNNRYAVAGNRAQEGVPVEGRSSSQQWTIQETRVRGQYTIATTDTYLFWGLVDNQTQTPVALASSATDTRNAWIFKRV